MKSIHKKINSANVLLFEKVKKTFFFDEVSNTYANLHNKKPSFFNLKPVKKLHTEDEYNKLDNFPLKAKRNNFL